ncbi:MAG: class I SAM-dependent methyltransferase [Mycobacteriales bacterium]
MSADYQLGFSKAHADRMYDANQRVLKAQKVIRILADHLGDLSTHRLLDIGCSTGFMTAAYAEHAGEVVGIDIDAPALEFAARTHLRPNLRFELHDSMATGFDDASFSVVTCTHIYEHVPDATRLIAEIRRVLRPGGVCFFAAPNRLQLMEPHYRLPLLSWPPKAIGHRYVRATGRAEEYYEKHLTLWGLRRLTRDFEVVDYTIRVLADPERFAATDLVAAGSVRQRLALALARPAYLLMPTYLWVLRKP